MKLDPERDYRCYAIAAWCVTYAIEHGGNGPSIREICDQFDLPVGSIAYHLDRLIESGIVERVDGKLVVVGATYVPPTWYISGIRPAINKADNGRRNKLPVPS